MSEWQPIETAPENGFFLVHENGAMRTLLRSNGAWISPTYPALVALPGNDVLVGHGAKRVLPAGFELVVRDGCCEKPTHWMPLPPPPEGLSG